jgi:hypothetical protein
VKGINIRRFKRRGKSRNIRTSTLCGEYPSWDPYIFLERGEGGDYI